MKTNPLVSVIIPTYNRAFILETAIRSALKQTYPQKEIIVVDDGSDDETAALVKSFQNVTYVWQPHAGQGAARNTGLKNARGAYIASLDSDDTWKPDFLERCVQKLEAEQLDFVFANWYQSQKTGEWVDAFSNHLFFVPFLKPSENSWTYFDPVELRRIYLQNCPSPSSSLVIRRSSVKNGWNERLHIGDDWGLLLDMIMAKPCRAACTNVKLWHKHINNNNVYDGRDIIEVIRLLKVEDARVFMQRYATSLTTDEKKYLQNKYVHNLVELVKHHLVHDIKPVQASVFLKQAFASDSLFTIKAIRRIFLRGLRHNLNKVRGVDSGWETNPEGSLQL